MAKKKEPFSGVPVSHVDRLAIEHIGEEVESFLLMAVKTGPVPEINTMGPYGIKIERDVSKKKEWSIEFYTLDSFAHSEAGEGVTLAEAWADFKENQG